MWQEQMPRSSFRVARWSVTVIITALFVLSNSYSKRAPIDSLTAAAEGVERRETEARLADFPYAPRVSTRGEASASAAELRFHAAASTLTQTASDPHTRGIANLVSGKLNRALKDLDVAARSANNPSTWSDLAAVYYEIGRRQDKPEELASAVGAAVRALDLDPAFAPALFNRGLALDALRLTPLAADAYRDYLAVDTSSDWAEEVRAHLHALPSATTATRWETSRDALQTSCLRGDQEAVVRIVQAFPEQTRRWGEGVYLGQWAELQTQHRPAIEILTMARCIGGAQMRASGERLLADTVAAIDRATDTESEETLAKATTAYIEGRKKFSNQRLGESAALFSEAIRGFKKARSPMALAAACYLASAIGDAGDPVAALRILDEIEPDAAPGYMALSADISSARGIALARLGHMYEAVDATSKALHQFELLGETDNCTRMRTSLIAGFSELGRPNEAWRMRRQVLASASASGHPRVLQAALNNLVFDEYAAANWNVVAAFADEAARAAPQGSDSRAMALMFAACSRAKAGKPYDARSFDRARAAARMIADSAAREEVEDSIRLNVAVLTSATQPAEAVRLLDATIQYRSLRFPYRLPAAYAARARAWRTAGDGAAATEDYERAIAELEKQRTTFANDALTIDSYVGDDDQIFRDAIELAASRADWDRLFSLTEQNRARAVRERAGSAAPLISLVDVPPRIDGALTLVSFTVLPEQTAISIITRRGVRNVVTPLGRRAIRALAAKLDQAVAERDDRAGLSATEKLYDALLAEISPELAAAETLVFITDDHELERIPFGALLNSKNGRRVIEDHQVIVAPSVATFVASQAMPAARSANRLLAAGDPAFDRNRFPSLERLTAARNEVDAIAKVYPGADALVDSEATRARVMELLPNADVIHLAAHSLAGRTTGTSVIPLAESGGDSGLLYVRDVASLHLSARPVVVLAGCQTAVAEEGPGSVRSFSMAFLAAGARAVVATLWDVRDDAGREFSVAFHKQLRKGLSPAAAAREAQLGLMREGNVTDWAAFQLYGYE